MIDTHAHLQHHQYTKDMDKVLDRAAKAGITAVILPGTDLEDSRAAIDLAERYADAPCALYAAAGIHPTSAHHVGPSEIKTLRSLAQHPRVVAIGEIGLDDYWPNRSDRRWPCASPGEQRLAFKAQLALAAELDLPVIIHDRDAHEDTLRILENWTSGGAGCTGVLHAYAAGPALLEATLDLGFFVGMDGPVTFGKAHDLHDVARHVPLERLLLETDAPYLTPHPHRGRRNEPSYLPLVAARIAELRGTTPEQVNDTTTHNAHQLFTRLNV